MGSLLRNDGPWSVFLGVMIAQCCWGYRQRNLIVTGFSFYKPSEDKDLMIISGWNISLRGPIWYSEKFRSKN